MAKGAIAAGGAVEANTALREVLKTALLHSGLAQSSQSCQSLRRAPSPPLCARIQSDEPMQLRLAEALCAEHHISLIKADDNKKLGGWAGLCKIDREGQPCKVVGCSYVVVKDYGKESQAKDVIEEYFKCKK